MKQYFNQSDGGESSSGSEAPEEVHKLHADHDDEQDMPISGRSHSSSSSEADDEDESDDELDQQEQVLEQRLAEVPLEAVTKQLKDGKGPVGAAARAAAAAAKQQVFHRETKNRPQQLSSKRPVSRFREVLQIPKQ